MIKALARRLPKKYVGLIDYFMFRPHKSYSQHGEDIIAYNYFKDHGPAKGIYVDIGCFHPKRDSNTFILHKCGWKGVNIDVDPYKISVFGFARPKDINCCVAVSEKRGSAEFFYSPESVYGSMSGLDETFVRQEADALSRKLEKRVVSTMPLMDILRENSIDKVDFLTIDVEGHEPAVLGPFDFSRYPIALIALEIHGDFEEVLGTPVHKLLDAAGYKLYARTGPTIFYSRRNDIHTTPPTHCAEYRIEDGRFVSHSRQLVRTIRAIRRISQ